MSSDAVWQEVQPPVGDAPEPCRCLGGNSRNSGLCPADPPGHEKGYRFACETRVSNFETVVRPAGLSRAEP